MSTTTPPYRPGSRVATGVRVHPNGRSLEVRVRGFDAKAGFPLTPEGQDAATAYAIRLRERRGRGDTSPATPEQAQGRTLADATRDHLTDLERVGGRQGTPYGPAGMKRARQDARPWLGEPVPDRQGKGGIPVIAPKPHDQFGRLLGLIPLDELRIAQVAGYLVARYQETPRAAVGESQMFRAVIERELGRGADLNRALLAGLPRLKRQRQTRPPFGMAEYELLLGHVVEHQRRCFRLGITLGGRIMELLAAEDAWLNDEQTVLTVPAWACKERREKLLPLLAEETRIVREARLVRSPDTVRGRLGTRLLFPRKQGGAWRHTHFYQDVILPARQRAAIAWRMERDLASTAPTPFEWPILDRHGLPGLHPDGTPRLGGFQPHDMRRSAATIMRKLGVPPELAAIRLGHKDAGYLLLTTYADSRPEDLRAALARIDAAGGVAAALEAAK